jgi:hypothetical protein
MKLTVKKHFEPTQNQRQMINAAREAQERDHASIVRRHKLNEENALYELTEAGKGMLNEER